jgi:hypothetical protein
VVSTIGVMFVNFQSSWRVVGNPLRAKLCIAASRDARSQAGPATSPAFSAS